MWNYGAHTSSWKGFRQQTPWWSTAYQQGWVDPVEHKRKAKRDERQRAHAERAQSRDSRWFNHGWEPYGSEPQQHGQWVDCEPGPADLLAKERLAAHRLLHKCSAASKVGQERHRKRSNQVEAAAEWLEQMKEKANLSAMDSADRDQARERAAAAAADMDAKYEQLGTGPKIEDMDVADTGESQMSQESGSLSLIMTKYADSSCAEVQEVLRCISVATQLAATQPDRDADLANMTATQVSAVVCFRELHEAGAHPDKATRLNLVEAVLLKYFPHVASGVGAPIGGGGKGSVLAAADAPQATPIEKPGA